MRKILLLPIILLASCKPASSSSDTSDVDDVIAEAQAAQDVALDALEDGDEATGNVETVQSSSGWRYEEKEDEMRGETSKIARLDASKPITLGFPYGESIPKLWVRQDPEYGFDIFITANGQFICRSYRRDTVSVKFDDGPIKEWSCNEAETGSSNIIFLNREKSFLAEIKKAEKLIVEVEMYDAGRQQISFSIKNLEWE